MYYAAFGIFTNGRTMKSLVGDARLVGRGKVKGFRFAWRGCADIERDPDTSLDVVVWDIDQTMLNRLDRIEGYPIGYDRLNVTVDLPADPATRYVTAAIYIMVNKGPLGVPGDGMFHTVSDGHAEHGLSRGQIMRAYRQAMIEEESDHAC